MSAGTDKQYTLNLKSAQTAKQYSLYVSGQDRLSEIGKFLKNMIPDIVSEDQFMFRAKPEDAPLPHHLAVSEIVGRDPC